MNPRRKAHAQNVIMKIKTKKKKNLRMNTKKVEPVDFDDRMIRRVHM